MSKSKKIVTAVTIVWLCLLMVVFTYSWVVRNLTPSITIDNMQIDPSGALVVSLTGDDNSDVINLNKVAGYESFVFKQVSSVDAKNFMWLDFTPTLEDLPAEYRADALEDNYIDTRFAIKLDDSLEVGRYVFLHEDCSLTDTDDNDTLDVAKAMRIALDYDITLSDGTKENRTYILGNTTDNELIDNYTDAVKKDAAGKRENDPDATTQQTVYSFEYFSGESNGQFDDKRCLFFIEPGQLQWVNLRIWLEGADDECVNEIAGQTFDMVLKFDSVSAE